jgi:hypothetical protein
LLATQTASSSAALQFTNLPTSYNTLFLNCSSLLVSNGSTTLLFQVGEGAGPTRETGSNYLSNGIQVATSGGTISSGTCSLYGMNKAQSICCGFATGDNFEFCRIGRVHYVKLF